MDLFALLNAFSAIERFYEENQNRYIISEKDFEGLNENEKKSIFPIDSLSRSITGDFSRFRKKLQQHYRDQYGMDWEIRGAADVAVGLKMRLSAQMSDSKAIELGESIGDAFYSELWENFPKDDSAQQHLPFNILKQIAKSKQITGIEPLLRMLSEKRKQLRNGFKIFVRKREKNLRPHSISFIKSSYSFNIQRAEYKFNRGNEDTLGNDITEMLESILGLEKIKYAQSSRSKQKYENVDFFGYSKKESFSDEEIFVYAFELKVSNSVQKVSEAIAQAINYKKFSNFSYIIIPNFNAHQFPDMSRYGDFVNQCNSAGVGVISINIVGEEDRVSNLEVVIEADLTDISDAKLIQEVKTNWSLELCPLCRRVVRKTGQSGENEVIENCGWTTDVYDETGELIERICMRRYMEAQAKKMVLEKIKSVDAGEQQ